jgi:putative transposase
MPYEYRKMTPEERQQVLTQRRERSYPLHGPPHPFREASRYLLTAANFEHANIMASPERRTDFETRLIEAMHSIEAEVFGWVILPNHFHILVGVQSLDAVSAALKLLHGSSAHEWNQVDNQIGKRRVWYRFADRVTRSDGHFYQALNYIHINPVKHQYTDDPYDWPWSSLGAYLEAENFGRDWLREQWKSHPPGDFGRGWDD